MTENLEYAKRFKQFRQAVFKSQHEMAEYLNVKQSLVSRMESGVRTINPEFIDKLIKGKGLNPAWYHTGKEAMITGARDKPTTLRNLSVQVDILRSEVEALKKSNEKLIELLKSTD